MKSIVRPPKEWMDNTLLGKTSSHRVPYEYANWALKYLGCNQRVSCGENPTIRVMWQIHEACLKYRGENSFD